MRAVQSQTPECRSVRAQLVGDQQFAYETLLLEQLTHQPQRRPGIASALNQHVEDLAFVVHGTPQIHWLSGDYRSEFQHPTPDRFVGDVEPALRQQFLDVPITQGKTQIQPDSMLDDHRRKAVAAIGDFGHRASLPAASLRSYPVTLTRPMQAIFDFGDQLADWDEHVCK